MSSITSTCWVMTCITCAGAARGAASWLDSSDSPSSCQASALLNLSGWTDDAVARSHSPRRRAETLATLYLTSPTPPGSRAGEGDLVRIEPWELDQLPASATFRPEGLVLDAVSGKRFG